MCVYFIVTIGFGPSITGASYIAEWDLNNEVISTKYYSIGSGHSLPVNALKVINDTHLVSGSDDLNIKVWLISTGTCIRSISVGVIVKSLAILKNGYLAVGIDATRNNIKIYDINTAINVNTIDAHNSAVNTLEVFSNGDLASGGSDNYVKVWDTSTLVVKYSNGFGNNVNCLKILPNGNIVVGLLKNSNNLHLWVPGSASSLISVTAHASNLIALEVLADGSIVSSSDDNTNLLKIWDQSLNLIGPLTGQSAIARTLKLLPTGFLASGTDNSKLHIWNMTARALVKSLSHNLAIHILAIEYKGKCIISSLVINLNFER